MNRAALFLLAATVMAGPALTGCAWSLRGATPPQVPNPEHLRGLYQATRLGTTGSGEVLASVQFPDREFVANSRRAVAVVGPRNDADRMWLTLADFGEESVTASGKYFFLINDKPRGFLYSTTTRARLEAEQFFSEDILAGDYPDENVRQIAILADVRDSFNLAVDELKDREAKILSCAMAFNGVLNALLVQLEASPAKAEVLHEPGGLFFDHPTLGMGRARMIVYDDGVKLIVILGTDRGKFMRLPEVRAM